MGRQRALAAEELAARLREYEADPALAEAELQQLMWRRLDDGTARQYRADLEYLQRAAQLAGLAASSTEMISLTTLALIKAEASPEVVGRVRSAWRFGMSAANLAVDEPRYQRSGEALAGWRRQHKRRRIPRGACSFGQVEQLMASAAGAAGGPLDPRGFLLAYLAVLRAGQVEDLLVGDVRFRSGASPVLVLHTCLKKRGRNGEKLRSDGQPRTVPLGEGLLQALVAGRQPEEPLFPGWCSSRASALVRTTAECLGWSDRLKWDGLHCLRHGGKLDREIEDQQQLVAELAVGGWSAECMARWYGRVR